VDGSAANYAVPNHLLTTQAATNINDIGAT
jgi:hypothetical protein